MYLRYIHIAKLTIWSIWQISLKSCQGHAHCGTENWSNYCWWGNTVWPRSNVQGLNCNIPTYTVCIFPHLTWNLPSLIALFSCRTTWAKCLPTIQQWCPIHLAHQLWFSPGLDLCLSYLVITARLAPYLPSQISKFTLLLLQRVWHK